MQNRLLSAEPLASPQLPQSGARLRPPSLELAHPPPQVPDYLHETYWWAYVHPRSVRIFERQWLVNLILWGNYRRLRDAALDELGAPIEGTTLQVACVYGDFTAQLLQRIGAKGRLDVIDVLPVQLANLRTKLGADSRVRILHRDAASTTLPDASYDRAVLFFLLHEQPEHVRRRTLAETWRMVKPGGKIVIVDYCAPSRWHPLRMPMRALLRRLEPYALDLWREEVQAFLPSAAANAEIGRETFFGGLYQKLVVHR